ncbi:hypothetical protein ACIOWI_19265 [Streptomyces sp. NPDC087659]|uniref:hypothetical protein n=1 Tax=Streptomyces sp. NPDC087659 TaxID=3365801 RepID=UPI00381D806F
MGSGLTDSDLGLAASLHLFAAFGIDTPVDLNGRQSIESPYADPTVRVEKVVAQVPGAPGLGVEVDEKAVRRLAVDVLGVSRRVAPWRCPEPAGAAARLRGRAPGGARAPVSAPVRRSRPALNNRRIRMSCGHFRTPEAWPSATGSGMLSLGAICRGDRCRRHVAERRPVGMPAGEPDGPLPPGPQPQSHVNG